MSRTALKDPWIVYRKPRPHARVRLLCFPYAGGGAMVYRDWTTGMPAEIDVLPVQPPGREQRMREKAFTRMEALVDALVPALLPYLDRPFAFFGHSMGAVIGYEVAHRLRRDRGLAPVLLAVSARRAPHLPPERHEDYKLPDPELRERLREMNGTPAAVLENPELMELMLPLIRADFELNDTYRPAARPPLECPVAAYGGVADEEVSRQDLEAWRELTRGPFELRMFPGDHFFLHPEQRTLTDVLARDLLSRIAAPR